jgi:hypothetical protein
VLTLSGALDVWRAAAGQGKYEVFTAREVRLAEQIARATPPHAVILSAPVHNSAVMLAGRRMFMTYPGFLWTNGLPYEEREKEVETLYAGGPAALELLHRRGVGFIIIGHKERDYTAERRIRLNEAYFAQFPRLDDGSVKDCRLYRVP